MSKNCGKKCAAKIVFAGTPEFAAYLLEYLINNGFNLTACISQPDKAQGRQQKIKPSAVKRIAQKHKLPLWQPAKLKDNQELINQIKSINPDFLVVASYGKIIPQEILNLFPKGPINVHASLLPQLRGASPISAAIIQGFAETGITIMQMNEKMDEGSILAQEKVRISQQETTNSLTEKLKNKAAPLLAVTLGGLCQGKLKAKEQNHRHATYCPIIKKKDGEINWQEKSEVIARRIRALNPWPGTFTFWQSQRLKIMQATESEKNLPSGKAIVQNQELLIGTGDKSLSIKKLQLAGKKQLTVEDFLRGYADRIDGQQF